LFIEGNGKTKLATYHLKVASKNVQSTSDPAGVIRVGYFAYPYQSNRAIFPISPQYGKSSKDDL
jgi:hypothetical protein